MAAILNKVKVQKSNGKYQWRKNEAKIRWHSLLKFDLCPH